MLPRDVCIVGYRRTPVGSFGGSLSKLSAVELGAAAIKDAIRACGVRPQEVQEVFMGNVLQANVGQAPARQAALGAGLPYSCICTTVNKVCASGMKAIMLGAQAIKLGQREVVVCGGMESMSNVPFYVPTARFGNKMGNTVMVDGMTNDGLWDPYHKFLMGNAAEQCAKTHNLTRQMQDDFAVSSYTRAMEAQKCGAAQAEIVPIQLPAKGTPPVTVAEDEEPKKGDFSKFGKLKPAFPDSTGAGTVTAANSSKLSDGAAALVLVSAAYAKRNQLKVLAVITGFDDAEQEPALFPTTPALAIPRALNAAGVSLSEVDFFEINEAFAAVALVNKQLLNLDPNKLNVHGGAVALGHPLGASGARIVGTLLTILLQKNGNIGCAAICNGGGGGSAIVIKKVNSTEYPLLAARQ